MSTEDNTVIAKRFVKEVWNKGNMAVADELFAPGFVNHGPLPGLPPDAEGYKQNVALLRKAFPDLHLTIEHIIGQHSQSPISNL